MNHVTEQNDARAAVLALLAANNVTFSAVHRGERVKDKTKENPRGWTCDAWSVAFVGGARETREDFDYFTGTGHRVAPKWAFGVSGFDNGPPPRPGSVLHETWMKQAKPAAPHAADVLHSLILDSSAVGQLFESWCEDYGYDSDSRKAEATYRACQENADKLARVLGGTLIAELSKLLEDY